MKARSFFLGGIFINIRCTLVLVGSGFFREIVEFRLTFLIKFLGLVGSGSKDIFNLNCC